MTYNVFGGTLNLAQSVNSKSDCRIYYAIYLFNTFGAPSTYKIETKQGLTSHKTHYRSYWERFLQVI